MKAPRLGVNIDHFATLRQLRGTPYPDLKEVARTTCEAGADLITIHLREDRRHIQDQDVKAIKDAIDKPLNLEMATASDILSLACKIKPHWVCLVPEKRKELTTEGGLNLESNVKKLRQTIEKLQSAQIQVSLFIEPSLKVTKLAYQYGAQAVEFHTGRYALKPKPSEISRIQKASLLAKKLGLGVHAGHGLDATNVRPLVGLKDLSGETLIAEYNIGHFLVCRSALIGLKPAIREMLSSLQAL